MRMCARMCAYVCVSRNAVCVCVCSRVECGCGCVGGWQTASERVCVCVQIETLCVCLCVEHFFGLPVAVRVNIAGQYLCNVNVCMCAREFYTHTHTQLNLLVSTCTKHNSSTTHFRNVLQGYTQEKQKRNTRREKKSQTEITRQWAAP